jgi:organic hydroperoxide reductase OsmC/OhrA
MLTFLAVAARRGLVVDAYEDHAVGVLEKNAAGVLAVTRVILNPVITWAGDAPSAETVQRLHEMSHKGCFIANSVKTEVVVGKS